MTTRLPSTLLALAAIVALAAASEHAVDPGRSGEPVARFEPVRVYLDTKDEPLAAYQVELWSSEDRIMIVGIEGGDSDVFAEPPYYDPAAMRRERVVIAAFSTAPASRLPTGRTRVATIHLRIEGDEEVELAMLLHAVATIDGREIDAGLTLEQEPNP